MDIWNIFWNIFWNKFFITFSVKLFGKFWIRREEISQVIMFNLKLLKNKSYYMNFIQGETELSFRLIPSLTQSNTKFLDPISHKTPY